MSGRGLAPSSATRKGLAIIVPELLPVPPERGGAIEHWVHELTHHLKSNDRPLAVVSRPALAAGLDGISYLGIPWTPTERRFQWLKDRVTWGNPLRYVAKIQNVWSYGRRVDGLVRDFSTLYLQNEPNLLLFLKKRPGQKIVLHMHNDHLSSRLFRPLYRRLLARTDLVLCVSDYIRRQAAQCYPEYAPRFKVIFNSTDPSVFKPYGAEAWRQLEEVITFEPKTSYLLYVGRLTALKGVHVLIEAFRRIHARNPNTRLIIAGTSFFAGATRTAYEQQLERLAAPLRDAILFTGFLPHHKLKYLYSAVDVVALPSVWQDPCPLVALEAMSSGTCLVSSAVGGVPELVDHQKTGVLVPPDDAGALADAVVALFDDPVGRQRMEVAAREKILAGYSWERLAGEVKQALGEPSS